MGRPFIAANWKMHKTRAEAQAFVEALGNCSWENNTGVDGAIFAPFTALDILSAPLAQKGIALGAQNFYPAQAGAFTGEIAPGMLKELGVTTILVGHSERRSLFAEDDELVGRKVTCGMDEGWQVVLCVGESLAQYEAGETIAHISDQLRAALTAAQASWVKQLVVAYEPIWAIGTGLVATAADAEAACGALRAVLADIFGAPGKDVSILYGGSVKPDNIAELLAQPNIDGALIGGAGLVAEDFCALLQAGGTHGQ